MMPEINTRYGKFVVMENDQIISSSLRLYGEWAQLEIDTLAPFILPGHCVYDVGAFIGTHARAFSQLVGEKGSVISFEPRAETRLILEKNADLAAVKNISIENFALGRINETRTTRCVNESSPNNFGGFTIQTTFEAIVSPGIKQEEIHIRTIDSFTHARVDFIKIDVEGMEIDVLNGATDVIARDQPCIFAECNTVQSGVDVLRFCGEHQYRVYGVTSRAYNEDNFKRSVKNIFSSAVEIGLLLVPESKLYAFYSRLTQRPLPELQSADDLVLLLLHKPQYPYEVLAPLAASLGLDLQYPSARSEACLFALDTERALTTQLANELAGCKLALADTQREVAAVSDMWSVKLNAKEKVTAQLTAQVAELEANRQVVQADLGWAVDAMDRTVLELANAESSRLDSERRLQTVSEECNRIVASRSWLLTKPVRWIGRLLRGEFEQVADPFKRMLQSRREGSKLGESDGIGHGSVVSRPEKRVRTITVVLPIYRGMLMTERCISHALPAILEMPGATLFAINDCSPDPDMQAMINRFADKYPGTVIVDQNLTNLGFVRTVNKGLARFIDNDIVLLNSDVIVPKTWLLRLADEAYSCKRIGTVTPFSNNATICSFPISNHENPQPFKMDVDEIDSVFSGNKLECIASPTGIGFCMYIRRDCLNEIGFLDVERFGRGYGEENDLCQRGEKAGWRNLLSPNLYAYHEGGVSFAQDKQALIKRAMNVLEELHPHYHADVHSFIAHDWMKLARISRYVQLLNRMRGPKVLHVSHGKGGGVVQHIDEIADFYDGRMACLMLNPVPGNSVKLHLSTHPLADTIIFQLPGDFDAFQRMLRSVGVTAMHFHHSIELNRCILDLPSLIGVKAVITVHDFYWINGNPTLTNSDGVFEADAFDRTRNPLYELPAQYTQESWRDSFRKFLSGADKVIFPSASTQNLFSRYFSIDNGIIAPHIEASRNMLTVPTFVHDSSVVTVGVLGAIGKEKGADVLEKLALLADDDKVLFRFKLIGYAYRALKRTPTTGIFDSKQLPHLIKENAVDVIFFPARWPETYSYTLSYALDSGLPIFAPRIGAFIERLSGRAFTRLFDHNDSVESIYTGLREFIVAIRDGDAVYADTYHGERGDSAFYANRYIELVSKKEIFLRETADFNLETMIENLVSKRLPVREKLLRTLCKINANQSLNWARNAIPINVRRKVRQLVAGPFHR